MINIKKFKYHKEQAALWASRHRFDVVRSGRRSGKTEIVGKRRVVYRSLNPFDYRTGKVLDIENYRLFVAAPTRDQAKKIYWNDLKKLTAPFRNRQPNESQLILYLFNGSEIHVLGLDKPERIEGMHWDGGVLDEYGNMKESTWPEHVRPALSTPGRPPGWCSFIGVPEGRNHYYDLYRGAKASMSELGEDSDWGTYHWFSADILSPKEIESAKRDLDELTYQQEYEGSFVNFSGRAYYNFNEKTNCAKLFYNPDKPISFCFDFNVDPGVAVVTQEQQFVDPKTGEPVPGYFCTGVIGEVYIPKNSNTVVVCNKLIADWKYHKSDILVYGDATGGNRGSAKVQGSDWDLVRATLSPVFNRLYFKIPRKNPSPRARINAMNSRIKTISGDIRLQVDPAKAPYTVKDFEGVSLLKGGSGEIDKSDLKLTHLTDALGYKIIMDFPVSGKVEAVDRLDGF